MVFGHCRNFEFGGNAADACPPPRPAGLRLPPPANYCGLPVMIQLGMGARSKMPNYSCASPKLAAAFARPEMFHRPQGASKLAHSKKARKECCQENTNLQRSTAKIGRLSV